MDIRSFFQDRDTNKSCKENKSSDISSASTSNKIQISCPLKVTRPRRQRKELIIISSESEGGEAIEEPKAKKQKVVKSNALIENVTSKLASSCQLERPKPHPNCLNGKTFALSGIFDDLSRDDCIHLIKVCGGSISNSVTRNTNYLVLGTELENGADPTTSMKYKEAMRKNVQIISQLELYDLIKNAPKTSVKQSDETTRHQEALYVLCPIQSVLCSHHDAILV